MDSYRPGTDRGRRGVPSRDSYRPRRYDDEQRNGDDPWPPRNNRDDMFYFTAGDDHDRNRNRPRDEPPYRSRPRHQAQGARGRGRDQFRRPYPPSHHAKVSERPLLRMAQDAIEDPSLLQNGTGDKFRAVDDLTDSEEEEMAQSEDEEQGRTKRIRVHRGDADSAPAPKWSNPDPYTSLPPVQTGEPVKRTDVLRLIRKARLDADSTAQNAANQDDYISFDMDDEESDEVLIDPATLFSQTSMGNNASRQVASGDGGALGKRKRGDDLGDQTYRKPSQPSLYSDRWVLKKWMASTDGDAAPWFTMHQRSIFPGVM